MTKTEVWIRAEVEVKFKELVAKIDAYEGLVEAEKLAKLALDEFWNGGSGCPKLPSVVSSIEEWATFEVAKWKYNERHGELRVAWQEAQRKKIGMEEAFREALPRGVWFCGERVAVGVTDNGTVLVLPREMVIGG